MDNRIDEKRLIRIVKDNTSNIALLTKAYSESLELLTDRILELERDVADIRRKMMKKE